jgi:hypothetical protein
VDNIQHAFLQLLEQGLEKILGLLDNRSSDCFDHGSALVRVSPALYHEDQTILTCCSRRERTPLQMPSSLHPLNLSSRSRNLLFILLSDSHLEQKS